MGQDAIPLEIPQPMLETWQGIVDILAEVARIPAALIMRLTDPEIEVLVSSKSDGNPYYVGGKEHCWGSGLYCETVLATKEKLLVPNALTDTHWANNPDIKFNMVSYLGFPIFSPNGIPFGTICVLDNKENLYSKLIERLIKKFRMIIQSDLEIVHVNQALGDKNKRLTDYLAELQALRGIVPICAWCKSIRDDKQNWHPIEHYLTNNPETNFSHGICPECAIRLKTNNQGGSPA